MLWDVSARRVAGIRYWPAGLLKDGIPAFLTMIPAGCGNLPGHLDRLVPVQRCLRTPVGAVQPGSAAWTWIPDPLRSLAEYHRSAYAFHNGLSSEHSYEASAWTWLFPGPSHVFLL